SFNFGPDINDILHQFHGNPFFGHGFQRQQKNRDLRTLMELDLESTLQPQVKYVEIRDANGQTRTVQVNVPRGVQTNMQMRFAGHGDRTVGNIPAGDLFVEFRIKPHAKFKTEGLNLIYTATVNAVDAIIGCDLTLETLDNKILSVKIPAGTQNGTNLALHQQGLYDINNSNMRGDLIVEVKIDVPRKITAEQFEKLKTLI
ncbi:hypothetical protein EBU71_20015, partial [bacterium]|nr:hypothetical protein [Candidatus Elulimicrobium humile]